MMWNFAFFACFFAVFAGSSITNEPQVKDPSNFMVAIFQNDKLRCSGALVSNVKYAYIVTAAHCVYYSSNSKISIQLGPVKTTGNKIPVQNIYVHPYYYPPSLDYDIALLRTEKLVSVKGSKDEFNYFSEDSTFNTTTTTTTNKPSSQNPDPLMLSSVEPSSTNAVFFYSWNTNGSFTNTTGLIEARASCKSKLGKYVTVTGRMICVSHPESVTDGTPVLFNGNLAGIATCSRFEGAQNILLGVYANIADSEIYSFLNRYI